jgi:hypothetical protein
VTRTQLDRAADPDWNKDPVTVITTFVLASLALIAQSLRVVPQLTARAVGYVPQKVR